MSDPIALPGLPPQGEKPVPVKFALEKLVPWLTRARSLTPEEDAADVAAINERPDLVWVGLGVVEAGEMDAGAALISMRA